MKRTVVRKAVRKIYVMTDLEGVAGVENSQDWCLDDGRYYERARVLLTLEVNAAVRGFLAGGALEVVVSDGHGPGGIDPDRLDPRAELIRGWPNGWPLELDASFDALAFVGQHAKAGSLGAHLCHTQNMQHIDFSVNGVSLGEFGQLAACASELGVPVIFGCGDLAFAQEAQALVPGIETVAVKRGLRKADPGEALDDHAYRRHNAGAIHIPPERARQLIEAGARQAVARAGTRGSGLIPLTTPFERVVVLRRHEGHPVKTVSRERHPTSVITLLNMPYQPEPMR